ncbi:hypothetical protein OAC89_04295 [Deltaproteobacteria bacterium]|nr:hypothetical protein [Deltaproteobacteria bacterium]
MDIELRQKIEPIKMQMKCPDPFGWVNNENEQLCKARDADLDTYIECIEEKRYNMCKFNLSFSNIYLCRCPIRTYISRELGKY